MTEDQIQVIGMKRLIVYHGYYGCDTGCCGHYVDFVDPEDIEDVYLMHNAPTRLFEFDHPDDQADVVDFARRMVTAKFGEEHCADIDWGNCILVSYDECPG